MPASCEYSWLIVCLLGLAGGGLGGPVRVSQQPSRGEPCFLTSAVRGAADQGRCASVAVSNAGQRVPHRLPTLPLLKETWNFDARWACRASRSRPRSGRCTRSSGRRPTPTPPCGPPSRAAGMCESEGRGRNSGSSSRCCCCCSSSTTVVQSSSCSLSLSCIIFRDSLVTITMIITNHHHHEQLYDHRRPSALCHCCLSINFFPVTHLLIACHPCSSCPPTLLIRPSSNLYLPCPPSLWPATRPRPWP
jgi:hypothetical protein